MRVRATLRMGDPGLLRPAEPVREFGAQAQGSLISDKFDTMVFQRTVYRLAHSFRTRSNFIRGRVIR